MGLFGSLFAKEPQHPSLDPGSAAAKNLARYHGELGTFLGKVNDRLELIPTAADLYVFVGKPPDAFGVVWWHGKEEHNFKTLMSAKGLSQIRVQQLSDALRDSYKRHAGDPRFSTEIAGRRVTVTPSETFAADVDKIIREVG